MAPNGKGSDRIIRRPPSGGMMIGAARIEAEAARTGEGTSAYAASLVERVTKPLSEPTALGMGGEIVPTPDLGFDAPALRDTLENPNLIAVDASRDRLELLEGAGALELALDAAETIEPQNSLERMLAHQLALVHKAAMTMGKQALARARYADSSQTASVEAARLSGATARLMAAFQDGLVALQRFRSGGKQHVVVQYVTVERGGQAVVAGEVGPQQRRRKHNRGSIEK